MPQSLQYNILYTVHHSCVNHVKHWENKVWIHYPRGWKWVGTHGNAVPGPGKSAFQRSRALKRVCFSGNACSWAHVNPACQCQQSARPSVDWIGLSSVLRPRQHNIHVGYMGDGGRVWALSTDLHEFKVTSCSHWCPLSFPIHHWHSGSPYPLASSSAKWPTLCRVELVACISRPTAF